jgi:parallel beta-helix repeat protein
MNKRKRFLYALIATVVAAELISASAYGSVFSSSDDKVFSSLEKQFLTTEVMPDVQTRITSWKALLELMQKDSGLTVHGISQDTIKKNITHDYLVAGLTSGSLENVNIAIGWVQSQFNGDDASWSLIDILYHIASNEKIYGKKSRELAEGLVFEVEDSIEKSIQKGKLYYALASVLTMSAEDLPLFSGEFIAKAHNFIEKMDEPNQRIRTVKALADTFKLTNTNIPESYLKLYSLFDKDDVEVEDLIDISEDFYDDDEFNVALDALMLIDSGSKRGSALKDFFEKLLDNKEYSRAHRVALKQENPSKAADMWGKLAQYYYRSGYKIQGADAVNKAESQIQLIEDVEMKDKAEQLLKKRIDPVMKETSEDDNHDEKSIKDETLNIFEKSGIKEAVNQVRNIKDPVYRANTFRILAEKQSKKIDVYGAFGASETDIVFHPDYDKDSEVNGVDIEAIEKSIAEKMSADANGVILLSAPKSQIGLKVPAFANILKSEHNGSYIKKTIPDLDISQVSVVYYENNIYNSKFFSPSFGSAGFASKQESSAPDLIYIQGGVIDIEAIYDALIAKGISDYIKRDENIYTLNRPLIIGADTSVIINNSELRMSQEKGAYIVSAGKFFIVDSKIFGWSDNESSPAWAKHEDKYKFRPYITSYSGAEIYIANSELTALGYNNSKSYGLSITRGPNKILEGDDSFLKRSTGIIVDSSFNNLYYGFYSFEADGVVIVGNEYINNVIYGIDPHDRSENLVIAYNTTYDSNEKHGMIISREVNNSYIVGNLSFNNRGTGIMLERNSNNTMVYGNTVFNNQQDGISVFESDCNIIASNNIFDNAAAGVRNRNSYDVGVFYNNIADNKKSGIINYSLDLKQHKSSKERDFKLDPFHVITSGDIVGNTIIRNGNGIYAESINSIMIKDNKFIEQSPKIIRGSWFEKNPDAIFRNGGTILTASCPYYDKEFDNKKKCALREKGFFDGDGQDKALIRLPVSMCTSFSNDSAVEKE